MTKLIPAVFAAAAIMSACHPHAPLHTGATIIANGCASERPASWPSSRFRVSPGLSDTTLEAQAGALLVEVQLDSVPGVAAAQVSLWNQSSRQNATYGDSLLKITAPAGRYFFRARRIGAQTLQDSIDVRAGYVDTVKVTLGREVVCLLSSSFAFRV